MAKRKHRKVTTLNPNDKKTLARILKKVRQIGVEKKAQAAAAIPPKGQGTAAELFQLITNYKLALANQNQRASNGLSNQAAINSFNAMAARTADAFSTLQNFLQANPQLRAAAAQQGV